MQSRLHTLCVRTDRSQLDCRGAPVEGDSIGRSKTAGRQTSRVPLAENIRH